MTETRNAAIQDHHQADGGSPGGGPSSQSFESLDVANSASAAPLGIQIGLASDPGLVRERNEDSCLAFQFAVTLPGQQPLSFGLLIVADGLGGHAGGEQASALAARLAAKQVIGQLCLPLLGEGQSLFELAPVNEVLESAIRAADQAVRQRLPKAGTTLTLAFALGDGVYVAHVGDSRAYLGERGRLVQLTHDHSMAARLLEMGQVTPEEAVSQRHLLYKALGQGADTEPDIRYHAWHPHQYLLLCCDGLWSALTDQEMVHIIDTSETPGSACRSLAARANERGGEDNISVILAARDWVRPDPQLS